MLRTSFVLGVLALIIKPGSSEMPKECLHVISFNKERMCCDLPDKEITPEDLKKLAECEAMVRLQNIPIAEEDITSTTWLKTTPDFTEEECLEECFYQKKGFLTRDKKLNLKAITAEYMNMLKDSDWKRIAKPALKKCFRLAPTFKTTHVKCSSGAYQFFICFVKELYENCPAERWTKSRACRREKQLVEDCIHYVL